MQKKTISQVLWCFIYPLLSKSSLQKNDSSFVQGQRADLIQRTNEAGFQQTINCPVSFFLVMVADLIKATPMKVSPLLPLWTAL